MFSPTRGIHCGCLTYVSQRLTQLTLPTPYRYCLYQDAGFCEGQLKPYVAVLVRASQTVGAQH